MPTFTYQAVRPGGQKVSGSLDAANRQEALKELLRQSLQPVELKGGGGFGKKSGKGKDDYTLSKTDVLYMTEDLADLLEAGLQLEPALRTLEQREGNDRIQRVASALREQVREGISFSHALRSTSKSFSELYCGVVEAGELSGSLGTILRRQTEYISAQLDLQNRVRSALIYPCFLICAGIVLVIVFITKLVPGLTKLFEQTGRDLPFLTRMLIGMSDFFLANWWIFVTGLVIAVLAGWYVLNKPEGIFWWHQNQLKIPLFGKVLELRVYTQITFTLGTLMGSGIPLLKSIQLTNRGTPNRYLQHIFDGVTAVIEEGGSLSNALRRSAALPASTVDMISVGEQTGDLGEALLKVSRRYEKQLNLSIERLTGFIQPAIIILLAGLVGIVVYSVFDAIFESVSGLKVRS